MADKKLPEFLQQRIDKFEALKAKRAASPIAETPIKITLPDGSVKSGIAGKTAPIDIAKEISQGLANASIVARVNGVLWDLTRPFEGDAALELIKFDSPEGKKVFWHSSSHVLGQALELKFACELTIGPPLKDGGFYYDMALPPKADGSPASFGNEEYAGVEQIVNQIMKEKQPFERLVLTKEEALDMFASNKYKVELIKEKVAEGSTTTVYKCGPLIDLCKGPHIPHTGKVGAFTVWKNSSCYWKGDAARDTLQRVYGMSFPDKKQFQEWKTKMEEAEARDHRAQGKKQELYFFHPLSPGSAFFLPRGAKLYNKLQSFVREQYRVRGYTEVITPNMYNKDLWVTSGHWQNYKDNMFHFEVEKQEFALKPMNCPGHCLMFGHQTRSYRDLPLRFTDFGVLHRNELSGALTGLTRVRRFQQDDGHIFCRPDQIQGEIKQCLDFLTHVYKTFGFDFTLELSTRPTEKYLGDIETWNAAEAALESELNNYAGKGGWKLNPGDGAFYGPKIDIHVFDALRREHQCATIQLDFQLPIRFDLSYTKEDGSAGRPVIIHRAIFGSLERFIAILVENNATKDAPKWPFWISPRPVMIVPIDPKYQEYAVTVRFDSSLAVVQACLNKPAQLKLSSGPLVDSITPAQSILCPHPQQVKERLFAAGLDVEIDDGKHTFSKKIAEAQVAGYNYILVVGEKEQASGSVNIRTRDNVVHGEKKIEEAVVMFQDLIREHK